MNKQVRKVTPAQPDNLGKLPPQAVELEEVVLGALMLERDAIDQTLGLLQPDDFYKEDNKSIFKAIISLFDKNEPVDIKTVTHQLREDGINQIGTDSAAYYVSNLTARVNSAANIETHARIIKEQSLKRSLIQMTHTIQNEAYEDTSDVFDLLDQVDNHVVSMISHLATNTFIHLGGSKNIQYLVDQISAAKEAYDNNKVVGVPSGFIPLDRLTGGFRGSELIVIAARPAMGKTAFVASIMHNNAEFNNAVGMFSLEMAWYEIGVRMISMKSEVMLENLRNGKIQTYDLERVMNKSSELIGKPIYIDDSAALTIFQIRTKARLMKKKHGIKMLIVDYMQLASGTGNEQNRENEIAKISRGLKQIAKELDIPVIALSQLNRSVETRGGDKKPQLSDLRESGSIEQDADMVMFLYRPEYYGFEFLEDKNGNTIPTAGIGQVIVAKHRNGRTGTENLRFIGKYTKWDENVPDNEQEPYLAFPKDSSEFTISIPSKNGKD